MTVASGSRQLKIGLMLPQTEGMRGPGVRGWSEVSAMAQLAEQVGFDALWLVDHLLYKLEGEDEGRGVWEVWSLLSAIAAQTSRVELGTLVLAMGWRNPALLAKMVDTVEEISGGRLILGLGSGYHKYEYDAFGFPFNYKVSRFEEAIQILHGLLRNGEVDFEGKFHFARECVLKPRGPRPQGPPILMGTVQPRMMACMAKYADLWNAYYDDTHNKVLRQGSTVPSPCPTEIQKEPEENGTACHHVAWEGRQRKIGQQRVLRMESAIRKRGVHCRLSHSTRHSYQLERCMARQADRGLQVPGRAY